MFEAVIFDWDGTLADTRAPILYSFHVALREIGADTTDEQIDRLIGVGAAETFKEILKAQKVRFDDALIRRLVERKVQAELEISDKTKLFPGAMKLLRSLQGHVKMGVASMKNRTLIEYLLKSTQTQSFFAAVVAAEDIKTHKPDPEIFLKAAELLQAAPERCVVVEDSVFGVQAAKAAGMACVAAAQGAYSGQELSTAGADLVVSSLRERVKILEFLHL